jgi:hypothetical protein
VAPADPAERGGSISCPSASHRAGTRKQIRYKSRAISSIWATRAS